MVSDAVIYNHLSRSLCLSLSDAHTHANRSAAARASPRASATAEEMWQMHAVCAEGTARAAQAPATAPETCWTNAVYAQKVPMCTEKAPSTVICNHLSRSLFLFLSHQSQSLFLTL